MADTPSPDRDAHLSLAQDRLGIDPAQDAKAAARLAELLLDARGPLVTPDDLAPRFQDRPAIVLAPAPGGIDQVRAQPPGTPLIVAGSAVERAVLHELGPWLVVTDLDGSAPAHRTLSHRGVPMAVHAHGDNQDLLEAIVPSLDGPLMGTSQTPPPTDPVPLHRLGGFTDGDRACFIAQALGCTEIRLAGWDLEAEVEDAAKRSKLGIAADLLEQLSVPVSDLSDQALGSED